MYTVAPQSSGILNSLFFAGICFLHVHSSQELITPRSRSSPINDHDIQLAQLDFPMVGSHDLPGNFISNESDSSLLYQILLLPAQLFFNVDTHSPTDATDSRKPKKYKVSPRCGSGQIIRKKWECKETLKRQFLLAIMVLYFFSTLQISKRLTMLLLTVHVSSYMYIVVR